MQLKRLDKEKNKQEKHVKIELNYNSIQSCYVLTIIIDQNEHDV